MEHFGDRIIWKPAGVISDYRVNNRVGVSLEFGRSLNRLTATSDYNLFDLLNISAFNVILLRNFFEAAPKSFEEAAKMDGASELRTWWSVILPLTKPALATVAIFTFLLRNHLLRGMSFGAIRK